MLTSVQDQQPFVGEPPSHQIVGAPTSPGEQAQLAGQLERERYGLRQRRQGNPPHPVGKAPPYENNADDECPGSPAPSPGYGLYDAQAEALTW
ncbi:hypothetical protein GCM10010289_75340 [Streptomyces violascens]|nr:hypothetical protein GCM10010289_75340 [Streptomyces violascens]